MARDAIHSTICSMHPGDRIEETSVRPRVAHHGVIDSDASAGDRQRRDHRYDRNLVDRVLLRL